MTVNDIKIKMEINFVKLNEDLNKIIQDNLSVKDISSFVFEKRGKQIRALLAFLSAKLCGQITEQTQRIALISELLHTSSLIHDDIIDNAEQRRGQDSVKQRFGNKNAVLYGDYLVGKCLGILIEEDYHFLSNIVQVIQDLAEGELLQRHFSAKQNSELENYLKVIELKTASLMKFSTMAGAASSEAKTQQIKILEEFGYNFGMAYQIQDDISDYFPDLNTGKTPFSDIREKEITLPLISYLNSTDKKESILNFIEKDDKETEKIYLLVEDMKKHNSFEYSQSLVKSYLTKAKECLNIFENNETKTLLLNISDCLLQKNHTIS